MHFPKAWLVGLGIFGVATSVPACRNEIGDEAVVEESPGTTNSAAPAGGATIGLASVSAPPESGPSPAGGADGGATPAPDGGVSVASLDSDSQIAAVDLELHSRALVMGVVADARAQLGDIRLFAIRMVTDDSAAARRVAAIVQGAEAAPEDSALRRQLGGETGQIANSLWAAPRATFDRCYVDAQVATHASAVQMLTALMARTQDAVLQAELRDEIDAWQKQLDDARGLQTSIAGGDTSAPAPSTETTAPSSPS